MATPVPTDMQETADLLGEVRRLSIRRHLRFLIEWLLLALLSAAVWYALGAGGLSDLDKYPEPYVRRHLVLIHAWERFAILGAVGTILLLIIYYGTSYEVTPFGLFLPLFTRFFPFFPKLKRFAKDDMSSSEHAVGQRQVSSEEILDKIADMEIEEIPATGEKPEDELASRILRTSAHSAAKLAHKMESRINTHLILGILVGGAGLAVWWISFYYAGGLDRNSDLSHYLMGTIPRITILLFIELLAGFFLRQYRIGVEDLKYFLELRRRADAKRIAYCVFNRLNDRKAQVAFAKSLMEEKSDTRLAKGETTTTLYAIEKEQNEILKGLDIVGGKLEAAARAFKKSK